MSTRKLHRSHNKDTCKYANKFNYKTYCFGSINSSGQKPLYSNFIKTEHATQPLFFDTEQVVR